MIWILASALIAAAENPPSQPVAANPPECAVAGACRRVGDVTFKEPSGRTAVFHIQRELPWIGQGNLMLFPGDAAILTLEPDGAGLKPVLVTGGDQAKTRPLAAGEMRFSFRLDPKLGSLLEVQSARSDTVHYEALMVPPDMKPVKTSICSVQPGLVVVEMWPHPIVQLALHTFGPPDPAQATCY